MGARTRDFVCVEAREEMFYTYQVSRRLGLGGCGQTFPGAFGELKTTHVGPTVGGRTENRLSENHQ